MAKNVQFVRQISAVAGSYLGLFGQAIYDTGLNILRMHDGVVPGGYLLLGAHNNLSELLDKSAGRSNLGLGSAAVEDTTAFDVAGAAQAVQDNLEEAIPPIAATASDALGQAAGAAAAASAAQTTANTGVSNAAAAQSTANTAVTNAATAQTTANTAVTNAATAQTTANAAAVKANNLSDLTSASAARTSLGILSKISTDLAISAGATVTFNHAIGQQPSHTRYVLVCQSAEGFFSVGDIIDIVPNNSTTGVGNKGMGVRITTADVIIRFGSASGGNVFTYTDSTTGDGFTLTNTKWKLRIYAAYIPVT